MNNNEFSFDELMDELNELRAACPEYEDDPILPGAEDLMELMSIHPDDCPQDVELPKKERPRRVWSIPRMMGKTTMMKLYHRRLQRDRHGSPTSRKKRG